MWGNAPNFLRRMSSVWKRLVTRTAEAATARSDALIRLEYRPDG